MKSILDTLCMYLFLLLPTQVTGNKHDQCIRTMAVEDGHVLNLDGTAAGTGGGGGTDATADKGNKGRNYVTLV
jgi:hypothetical protein